jgi:hypothetical protein
MRLDIINGKETALPVRQHLFREMLFSIEI